VAFLGLCKILFVDNDSNSQSTTEPYILTLVWMSHPQNGKEVR
jgi:hypothetical protein